MGIDTVGKQMIHVEMIDSVDALAGGVLDDAGEVSAGNLGHVRTLHEHITA